MPTDLRRCSARSLALRSAKSCPLTQIRPALGRSNPPSKFSNVDFPEPDLPNKAMRSPDWTLKLTPRKACTGALAAPYVLATSMAWMEFFAVMTHLKRSEPAAQQQLLPAQLLKPRQAAAFRQVDAKISDAKQILVDESAERFDVLFHFQPAANVILVTEVLAGHVARVAAKRDFTHGVNAEKGNNGAFGFAANLVV